MSDSGDIVARFTGDTSDLDGAMDRTGDKLSRMSGRIRTDWTSATTSAASGLRNVGTEAGKLQLALTALDLVVPALGAAIGTAFGGPAGGVAGASIASGLLGIIKEMVLELGGVGDAAKAAGDAIDRMLGKLDRASAGESGRARFGRFLGSLSSSESARGALLGTREDIDLLDQDFARRQKELEKLALKLHGSGALKNTTGAKLFDDDGKLNLGAALDAETAKTPEGQALLQLQAQLEEAARRRNELLRQEAELRNKVNQLARGEAIEAANRRDDEQDKKDLEIAQRRKQILESTFSPAEKLQARLAELREEFKNNVIDANLFAKAGDKALTDFAKSLPEAGKTALPEALLRGSAGALSAINQARSHAVDPNKQLVDLARQQLAEQKDAVKALQQLGRGGQVKIVAMGLDG